MENETSLNKAKSRQGRPFDREIAKNVYIFKQFTSRLYEFLKNRQPFLKFFYLFHIFRKEIMKINIFLLFTHILTLLVYILINRNSI